MPKNIISTKKAKYFNKFNVYAYLNSAFNYVSGALFIVALTCVASFVILNINSGELVMSKGNKTFVNDSASVPTMQKTGGTTSIKDSANIPSMGQAPGSTTTSQGGQTGGGSSGGESKK